MVFHSTFIRLFYDLSVYRYLVFQSVAKSLFSMLLFYFSLAAIAAAITYFIFIPKLEAYARNAAGLVSDQFPTEMNAVIDNGQLSLTNLVTPVAFSLPALPGTTGPLSVYLDPTLELSQLATAPGQINIGRTGFRLQLDSSARHIESFSNLLARPVAFTGRDLQQSLQTAAADFAAYSWVIPLLMIVFGVPVFFIARLITAIFFSLMLYLTGPIFNRPYPYKSFLNLILHILMVTDIIVLLILILYQESFPIIYQAALIGTSLLVFFSLPKIQKLKL